jgi:glycosyltransferase involved in cell wall biosynthesis
MLRRCLERISDEELKNVRGEVILVDSDSTDDTYKVMCQFKAKCTSDVQVLRTSRPGLGFARNVGVAHAQSDFLAFTDDDCYLAPGYLEKASTILENARFQYCGGRILLYDENDAMFAVNYQNRFEPIHAYSFIPGGKIQGANMVIHRNVFDKIGGFNPALGAGAHFRCEDIEFIARASMQGIAGAYVPELVVYHHHGRKNQSAEFEKLRKGNDIARGAYYAAMISQGYRKYVLFWLARSFLRNERKPWSIRYYKIIYWELLGVLRFWYFTYKGII